MSLEHSPARQNDNAVSPYLTRVELAHRLRTSPVTVTRHWKSWGLKPLHVGGRLLFGTSEVEQFERRLSETGERV